MENKRFSREQRQLSYLVKKLNILLQETDEDLKISNIQGLVCLIRSEY